MEEGEWNGEERYRAAIRSRGHDPRRGENVHFERHPPYLRHFVPPVFRGR